MAEARQTARRPARFVVRLLMLIALSFAATARPALAQQILRDAETEALLRDISRPLIEAAGLQPENVRIVIIGDPSINAFVAGGQIVYIHSGLFTRAENANEVQGVIAHELGHIAGGHVLRQEGVQQATGILILSMLLGAAAIAAGGGEAGMAAIMAGQQAAMGRFLAFSRDQENAADQAGATFLSRAGVSGRGSIAFFRRLENMEQRLVAPGQIDRYAQTHPLSGERITRLEERYQADAAWDRRTDPALEERFQRVRAKLSGYVDDARQVLVRYPPGTNSIPAHYARAYAYHRTAHPEEANAEVEALLRARPHDPYFLELKGQVLLESGHPVEALAALREAVAIVPDQPLISALLGHALISTEDPANFEEAKRVLRLAVARDNDNPFAWYQLGIVYDREGDQARAALATAERYNLEGRPTLALPNAEQAMMGIPVGTPDWLRAQDIAMVSRSAVQRQRRNR